jgi:hypothetical protein
MGDTWMTPVRNENRLLRMKESERMSTQPESPAKRVQAKQAITKNDRGNLCAFALNVFLRQCCG